MLLIYDAEKEKNEMDKEFFLKINQILKEYAILNGICFVVDNKTLPLCYHLEKFFLLPLTKKNIILNNVNNLKCSYKIGKEEVSLSLHNF